ncbi:MAG: FAD-dependent oxidoreductase [Candidatus Dormibacteria bacterium]
MKVAVAGGGIAGLFAGLLLARAGHAVDVFESDEASPPSPPETAYLGWERKGVAQHRMPHQFLARLRQVLLERAPDLREALLREGATEYELFRKIPGGEIDPADEEMVTLFARRPVFEAVLRRDAELSGVAFHAGTRLQGLKVDAGSATGLRTTAGEVSADVVVDAMGRRTQIATWLAEHGIPAPTEERSPCAVVYYCRCYQLKEGVQYPDGPYVSGGPMGDAGQLRFNMMRGDNRTHTILLGVPSWDSGFRQLRHTASFDAVLRTITPLLPFLGGGFASPITEVMAMGDIDNVRRHYSRDATPLLPGLVAIGDSYCHTDPLFGWGATFAVKHGAALADSVEGAGTPAAVSVSLEAAIGPEADAAYRVATLEDECRISEWRGETLDPAVDPAAFVRHVIAPATLMDPVVFRAMVRRLTLLDPPDQIYSDPDVRSHATEAATARAGAKPPWSPATRDQLDTVMKEALK